MPETAEKTFKAAEVCKTADVAPYVLKYWLTEFPCLSASDKDKSPNRTYSQKELKIVSRIRQLLYDEGFTIAGAKKKIDAEIASGEFKGKSGAKKKPAPAPPAPAAEAKASPEPSTVRAPAQASLPSTAANAVPSVDPKRIAKELREILKILSK